MKPQTPSTKSVSTLQEVYSPAAAVAVAVGSGLFYGVVLHNWIVGLVFGVISGLSLDAIARQRS